MNVRMEVNYQNVGISRVVKSRSESVRELKSKRLGTNWLKRAVIVEGSRDLYTPKEAHNEVK